MKKTVKYLLLMILILTFAITRVQAKGAITELFQLDEKIKVNEELNGTSFLAGSKVTINETINGIGFIAGEEIEINGEQEYIFGFGLDTILNANIKKDIFLFSEELKVKKININRDAYLAGTTINIDGTINRNAYIYGTTVDIKGTIKGNVNINATVINIDKNAKILGTLKYNDNATINGLNDSIKTKTYKVTENVTFKDYLSTFISNYLHLTLLALVLVYFFNKQTKNILKQTKDKKTIVSVLGKGFLILIGVPIISLTFIMTDLFISIGVIALILYGILIYISEILVAYIIAHYLDKKYIKKNLNNYILTILGIFIVKVISIIPIMGGFIYFMIMLVGLGIIANMIIEAKK